MDSEYDNDKPGAPAIKKILDRSVAQGTPPPGRGSRARPSLRVELLKQLEKQKLLEAFEDFEESEEDSDEEAVRKNNS